MYYGKKNRIRVVLNVMKDIPSNAAVGGDQKDIFVQAVKALFLLIMAEKKLFCGFPILMVSHLESLVMNKE